MYSINQKKPYQGMLHRMRSVAIPCRFLFLFFLSVPYPFSIRSVLFCSRSITMLLVSVLGTCSEEKGFEVLIYKNASKEKNWTNSI